MTKKTLGSFALFALLLLCVFTASQAKAQEKPLPGSIHTKAGPVPDSDGRLSIINITVSIYYEGKIVGTMDYTNPSNCPGSNSFNKLPLGSYEVRFESPGYITVNRQTILRAGNEEVQVLVALEKGQGVVTLGPGPTIQDLEARIRKLEEVRK